MGAEQYNPIEHMTKPTAEKKVPNSEIKLPVSPDDLLHKLNEELRAKETVDVSALERVINSLHKAGLVESLESTAELSPADREKIGGMVKERGWFAMFKELKAGDSMAYFSSPGGEFSVKNLNTLFGEQVTDSIIDSRKKILNELMTSAGHELLSQDYRSASFKLSKEQADRLEDDLNSISGELNQRMREVFTSAIENSSVDESIDSFKFVRMKELLSSNGEGYRLNFGVSQIHESQNEEDKSNIVHALAECAQTAQLSRRLSKDSYGSAYDRDRVLDEIKGEKGINELGNQLMDKKITDEEGIEYQVFTEQNGKRVMNRDLLRLTRKGELKPQSSDAETFAMVSQYVRRINLIDLVKPFTNSEAENGEISERINNMSRFVEKNQEGKYVLKNDLSQSDREELASELKKDQKDRTYDAPEFFHKKATELKDCVYVNLDVLDLGVDLLLEYEQLIQEVGEDEEKLREASVIAGDKITEKMRAIRAKALEIFKKHFPEQNPIDRVGGDEIALAIEDTGDSKKVEEFMLALQEETGTRVVKTVVGSSDRHSADISDDPKNDDELLNEHLVALKRAENGSEIAKKIEKKMRQAELALEQIKGITLSDRAQFDKELTKMNIRHFKNIAVTENVSGRLQVVCRTELGNIESFGLDQVLNWIGQEIAHIARKKD